MNIQLFIPCFVDQLYPDTAFNMIRVLEKAGCTVTYNAEQTCCGQPAFNAGFQDDAKEVCTKFLRDFTGADYIVSPSASCTGFVRNYYPKLFADSSYNKQVKNTGKRIYEFSDFLVNVLHYENFNASLPGKATYHDSCAALRECKIRQSGRGDWRRTRPRRIHRENAGPCRAHVYVMDYLPASDIAWPSIRHTCAVVDMNVTTR